MFQERESFRKSESEILRSLLNFCDSFYQKLSTRLDEQEKEQDFLFVTEAQKDEVLGLFYSLSDFRKFTEMVITKGQKSDEVDQRVRNFCEIYARTLSLLKERGLLGDLRQDINEKIGRLMKIKPEEIPLGEREVSIEQAKVDKTWFPPLRERISMLQYKIKSEGFDQTQEQERILDEDYLGKFINYLRQVKGTDDYLRKKGEVRKIEKLFDYFGQARSFLKIAEKRRAQEEEKK